jgi:hypothetical protein
VACKPLFAIFFCIISLFFMMSVIRHKNKKGSGKFRSLLELVRVEGLEPPQR